MLIPVLILFSLVLFFLGFIVKQNTWGVGNYIAKDDEKSQCNIGYWITMIGVVMLITTLIVYQLKKSAKIAARYASNAYGSARTSVEGAYKGARTSVAGMLNPRSA